ncbi:hypothetical protein [Xenorhabdus hominickii]|uniref:Uncharacterized protein n=1 Tax=Xenorhabdus hominickii TaxID=351679 RepID=A0A1V0M4E8_XENHO|nr:hypothetical protein [Xenorhabdus hominickii]ARD69737.1 hypothetical protein [Xenorhabdus hominickii]PHM50997.1 hypothetical protein Xhom_04982 [Xenorhabdus hominickii]
MQSDDLRVYIIAREVSAYNINWVKPVRMRDKPYKTAFMVSVPGTDDKAHMRFIEYVTADLVPMG